MATFCNYDLCEYILTHGDYPAGYEPTVRKGQYSLIWAVDVGCITIGYRATEQAAQILRRQALKTPTRYAREALSRYDSTGSFDVRSASGPRDANRNRLYSRQERLRYVLHCSEDAVECDLRSFLYSKISEEEALEYLRRQAPGCYLRWVTSDTKVGTDGRRISGSYRKNDRRVTLYPAGQTRSTLIHEVAHALAFDEADKHGVAIAAHGREYTATLRALLVDEFCRYAGEGLRTKATRIIEKFIK